MMKKLTTIDEVFNLLTASRSSIVLGAAIETGLLQMLAEKPMSAEEVSRVMSIPGKRGYYWLQLLAELGILEQDTQGYLPSALTRSAILDAEDFYKLRMKHIVVDERQSLAGVCNYAVYISEPSIWKAQGLTEPTGYVEKMKEEQERAYSFTRLLYNLHQYLGNELAEHLDLTDVHSMMDIGGGSGVEAMVFARKYLKLSITTVDIENVCIFGRRIVEENQLSNRITFYPADFLTDELPQGFDFVLHCDVGVYGVEQFHKLWASLKPDGRIAVIFHFPPSENAAPVPFLEWAFLDSLKDPDFGFPSVAEVREQLKQASFQPLAREHTLSDGRIVIQARKGVSHE